MPRPARTTLAALLFLTILLPALTVPIARAQDVASGDVPMFRGNPARTGEMPGPGPDPRGEIVEHWTFSTGVSDIRGVISSSPTVVDGVVYVGSLDSNLYAIDAASGQQRWVFPTGDGIFASPAVVDGVVYVGSTDTNLYAIGNLTTVQTATAEAMMTETAVAIAMQTAAAEAGMTETAVANAMATQEAVQLSWQNYFWTDITGALSEEVAELPGMSIDDFGNLNSGSDTYLPDGYSHASMYPIRIAGGSALALVTLAIFPSKADADTAMETMSGGLIRSGWESQEAKGLDHDHACLTIQHTEWSEALCYMTREDVLIISYSHVQAPNPDAALLNAIDLANAMNDAYNQVDRPD